MVRLKVQLTSSNMIQSNRMLAEYIKLLVESKIKETSLSDGRRVTWGDPEHLEELERHIAEIQHRKSKHPRGSAIRADYAKVEARLRAELKSAHRHAGHKNKNIITEKD